MSHSSSIQSIKWFEGVCHQLSREPLIATETIKEFQDTKEAFQLSRSFFDHSSMEECQYQALAILQHSFLKNWNDIDEHEVKNYLWGHLITKERAYEASVYKKLIVVYIVIWKQKWLHNSSEERSLLFKMLSIYINENLDSPSDLMKAAVILHTILEVFSKKSSGSEMRFFSSGVNHSVHMSFQNDKSFCGLAAAYTLSLMLLSRAMQGIPHSLFERQNSSNSPSLRIDISEFSSQTCMLMVELLSWDFNPVNGIGNEESNLVTNGYEQLSVKVPADWVEIAGGPQVFENMLRSSIDCYLKLRNTNIFCEHEAIALNFEAFSPSVIAKVMKEYLFSFRQFMLALVSIASSNSASFPSEMHKVSYVTCVLETLTPILRDNVSLSIRRYFPKGYSTIPPNYFFELHHQEFEHLIFILIRVFGNFHLEIVGRSGTFENFMVTLSDVTLQFANYLITTLNSPVEMRSTVSESIWNSWRGDVLTQLLDLWAMILDDSLMQQAPNSETTSSLAENLRSTLSDPAATIFARLFDAIVLISIKEANECEDEVLDEEVEEIGQRTVDDLIDGISAIGRTLSLWQSLYHVQQTLSQSLQDEEQLYLPLLAESPTLHNQLPITDTGNVIRILEIQRLSVAFFHCLLFEGSGITTKGYGLTADDTLHLNVSSEIPVIPRYLVLTVSQNHHQIAETIGGVVANIARSVDIQRNLLEVCNRYSQSNSSIHLRCCELLHSLVSPIVMRGVFEFFADFIRYGPTTIPRLSNLETHQNIIRTYAGADASLYEHPDIAANIRLLCGASPRKSYLAVSSQPTSFTTLICGMIRCSIESIHYLGAEDLLCYAAIRLLQNIALYLSHDDIFFLVSSGDQSFLELWLLLTGSNSADGRNYGQWTNLLSPLVLTTLWEAVPSFTIRLISSATINMVTPIGNSVSWVLDTYLSSFQEMGAFLQSLLVNSNTAIDIRKTIACIRGLTRSHNPKLSMDYLEDELTEYYLSTTDDSTLDSVEFRPLAEDHLNKLESHRLIQLQAISDILDNHLGTLVHNLIQVPTEELELELVRELIVMMSDYVERQFPQLCSSSVLRFYESLLKAVIALTFHLHGKETGPSHISIMIGVLTLLDNLAIQEFCVASVDISEIFLETDLMIGETIGISDIVGVSLLLFSRVWSQETLEHYCELQKVYFSLLLYTLSSSSDFLICCGQNSHSSTSKLFTSIGMSEEDVLQSLNSVYSVLIWGITSHYPSTPRQAMQGIQHCALVGIKSTNSSSSSSSVYKELLIRFIWHCQDTFLFFLGNKYNPSSHSPASSDTSSRKQNGISWERVDSIASTFLAVIAFDVQRFLQHVIPQYLTDNYPDTQSQESLSRLLQQLFSNRDINLADYRKQNCRLFAENMSDFLNAC